MDIQQLINQHEEFITLAGKWGKYQKMISILMILTVMHVPFVVLTLPMNQKVPSFQYQNGTDVINLDLPTFCSEEYYYSLDFETISDKILIDSPLINWASDLKIVCHTKGIFSLVGTIYFIASIAGYLALSKFPDRYGRRTVFLYLNLFSLFGVLQMFFLVNYIQILIASFVLGLSSFNLAIGSVIINENVDGNYTALIMGLSMAMFPFGGLINTIFMYFFQDWHYYAFLMILVLLYVNYVGFAFLKESPKWLLANHKKIEYFETILFIAHVNGTYHKTYNHITERHPKFKNKVISSDVPTEELSVLLKEDYRKIIYTITDLFKYKSLRLLSICNLYLWVMTGFSFYGILLNLEGLTGNIFIDAVVSYTAEFFAEVLSGLFADKYGRKPTLFWSFVLAAVGSALFPFAFNYLIAIPLIFIVCIGIASAFNVLYIYSAELYPTNIKSLAVGVFFVFNRLSAAIVPSILTFVNNVIFVIFILSILAVGIMYLLPETLNTDPGDEVPEIVDDIYETESVMSDTNDFVSFNQLFDESF